MSDTPHSRQQFLSAVDDFWRRGVVLISLLVCACGTKSEPRGASGTKQKVSSTTGSKAAEAVVHKSGLTRCLESAATLPTSHRAIGEVFCREVRRLDLTGAALIFAESGKPASTLYYGRRCSNGAAHIDTDTHFAIASLTKSAAALVVLDLLDKNRRSLTDSLNERAGSPAVMQLLQHSAGTRAETAGRGAQSTRGASSDPKASAWFDAGELWHYDNANYQQLQATLDELGWKPEEAWTQRFGERGPQFAARPAGACDHTWLDGNPIPVPVSEDARAELEFTGGARATVTEVLELLGHIAAEARMIEKAIPTGEGDHYGLGLRVGTSHGGEHKTWWHTGAGLGSWAWMRGDEEGRRAAIMSNRKLALSETVAALDTTFFEVDPIPSPARPSAEAIRGEYRVREWDQPVTVREHEGRILLDAPALGTSGIELQAEGSWVYRAHLPMQAGSQTLLFVESKGQIWLRTPWFVARKTDPS